VGFGSKGQLDLHRVGLSGKSEKYGEDRCQDFLKTRHSTVRCRTDAAALRTEFEIRANAMQEG